MACNCVNNPAETGQLMIERADAIIDKIGKERSTIIPLLQALQAEFNYLPYDAIERVYERTEIDRAQLISVSTFYSQFRHVPLGKHLIKVCTGTACHVKGASNVYDAFIRQLEIGEGGTTTKDKSFSVEKIACLGCCTLAPVVQIDEKIYGHVMPGRVDEVIADFLELQQSKEKEETKQSQQQIAGEVRLGMGSCCMASGSEDIYRELKTASSQLGIEITIKPVGCVGVCNKVPLIDVVRSDGSIIRYPNVKAIEIKEILHHHFQPAGYLKRIKNTVLGYIDTFHTDITWDNVIWKTENERTGIINSFLYNQKHISTEGYGVLTPLNIDEYCTHSGFDALKKALTTHSRRDIVDMVSKSGLRGRGGGGFLTGKKWEIVAANQSNHKYMICNGDEGDPGAFMDRMMLESYPFRIIEGMLIAAYAVGADKGIFYIRAEYPLAVTRIKKAIELAKERGLIGKNIAGSDFSFDITVFEGAGAFVCGEETALIASIEGDRGFPKQRPPYPAVQGLNALPTLVNNVETLSQIPYIIKHGAENYCRVGTEKSKGTKVFALAGKINHGGLIEVPMGITLNQIIEDIGGGVENGQKLKAVQIGGPSGGCIPAELCGMQVDFDAFNQLGAMMGSGGLVVLSESDCMVDVARYFLSFTCDQSCGKCTFCRVGTRRMLDLLEKICSGKAEMADIDLLEELALNIKNASLCGLGKTAPNPVLTTLKYFRHEYEEHVKGVCKTGTCKDMVKYEVTEDCVGCTKCSKACPVDAIPYTPYQIHSIETEKCVLCGLCIEECSFDAIRKVQKIKS
ncbi:MAG: NADP-reducing hydrogenase subunit HndC [Candidatus Ordinivivax streblomastigis]|uniref:NADP-reducing hydrogenase subunit HndC n=1 Tax=Candidatus Ordinivivax streblomastigis TaxID=2540710 RepID=A0A5M8NYB5_9BACT|nr:MAG: NADP-reducing hydrogenase subunit HndC [Candidatus Ordinivivax streblomastigis]KAA6300500.1 MAG: NADP-reducing hydrogenase subunit HndC [Candidatus Ordinivivax streblomastigis]